MGDFFLIRAARLACRTHPGSFSGGVRGRARELCEELLSDRFQQFICGVSCVMDPKSWACSVSSVPPSAKHLEAARVAFSQSGG